MGSASNIDERIFQVKITLKGVSKPPVWRRVLVPAGIRLDRFHETIQAAMGWLGYHMHVFSAEAGDYGAADPDGTPARDLWESIEFGCKVGGVRMTEDHSPSDQPEPVGDARIAPAEWAVVATQQHLVGASGDKRPACAATQTAEAVRLLGGARRESSNR